VNTAAAASPLHPAPERPAPTAWAGLAARAARPAQGALYAGLAARAAAPAPADGGGLYGRLAARVNPAQYRPKRIAGVAEETIAEGDQTITVLRSPRGSYLRLLPAERELWQAMDGTKSVEELAMAGFLRYKQLLPVAGLVQNLRRQGFLVDAPVGLYRSLVERLAARGVEGFGQRLLRTLRSREFAIEGLDGFVGVLYRAGGRLLFSAPFAAIHLLITIAGLACFALVSSSDRASAYAVLDAANVVGGLLALWAALLISFVLHELAHALAVKHYGRRVPRGGVMIYYGMPAAFVDTSDIWLAGQRARIIVSLAGPLCDTLVGSLAAVAAFALPHGLAGAAAYKLAVACYLAALFNFNPLLELDGYYILVDWLRLPGLRQRALQFISGPLWQKLRARARLGGEERVFALYGLLAAAYTALATVLAGLFWQEQLVGVVGRLWDDGPVGRVFAALIVLGVLVPLGLGLLFAAWGLVRAAAAWAARRGLGQSPLVMALALTALAVALAGLPLRFGLTVETALIAPLLWLTALCAQVVLHRDYERAAIGRALDSFLVVGALELLALGGYLLAPARAPIWAGLEIVGFGLLLFAGLIALLDVDLRQSRPAELAASALLLAAAFLGGGLAIAPIQLAQPASPFVWLVIQATPVYSSLIALALLLPLLVGLHDSRLRWSWLLLWLGIGAQTASYMLELLPAWRNTPPAIAAMVLAAGLWAAAWCSHLVALRQIGRRDISWPLEPALGEAERLRRAFQHTYAVLYRTLRAYAGSRRARMLDDRMDVLAATANWEITLDREAARVSPALAALPLDAQGLRYAEVLRYTVGAIQGLCGATFARRAVLAAYDALPWPEREAADRRCFPHTPWAAELSRAFGDARESRLRLLRQVELFDACDDAELRALAEAMESRRARAGNLLLGPVEQPAGLWIVEAGEVAVKEGERLAGELHRGACFGAVGGEPAAGRSYQASVESDLLFLPAAELQRMLNEAAPHTAEGMELIAKVRLLERVPMLDSLPRSELRALARAARRLALAPRSVVVREGRPSGMFYVIESGQAAVVRRAAGGEAAGKAQVIARLGPAEFFGELELLRGAPPVASVVTIAETRLLALPHAAIAALLTGADQLARGLEQVGSGRLLELSAEAQRAP